MNLSWYEQFFGEDYWAIMEASGCESDATLPANVRGIITDLSPGRRIVDFGCGTGAVCAALAGEGLDVTGLDISEAALARARRRAIEAGINARFEHVDFLSLKPWPLDSVDVALCVDSIGFGTDAQQRSFFRRVRWQLANDGILIIVQSDVRKWIDDLKSSAAAAASRDIRCFGFECNYDAITGRARGALHVALPGKSFRALEWNVRVYTPSELIVMVRSAGFAVEAREEAGALTILARPLPLVSPSLAPISWRTPPQPGLELRYAPDEMEFVDQPLIDPLAEDVAAAAAHYPVDDPYGAERGALILAKYFGCPLDEELLTFAPGVTTLLRCLSGLAENGLLMTTELAHPDIQAWAMSVGCQVRIINGLFDVDRLKHTIRTERPALLQLDRPDAFGDLVAQSELHGVCRAAASVGTIVLIDESAASILPPAASAVRLVNETDNLVVLRGMTKAYSCGGLRVAFSVASKPIARRVREMIPPICVNELAFRIAMQLIKRGDMFVALRRQVRLAKIEMIELLSAADFEVMPGHPEIQWVLVRDVEGSASSRLIDMGIRGLEISSPQIAWTRSPRFVHLAIPLSQERMRAFRGLLTSVTTDRRLSSRVDV